MRGNQPRDPLKKKRRGRPVTRTMPEPIPDTPENIARIFMNSPKVPEGGWQFLKGQKAKPDKE